MTQQYNNCDENRKSFDIRDYVEFDQNGRALCPACSPNYSNNHRTLALVPNTDGAYKCFRECSTEEIREALGQPKTKVVPQTLGQNKKSAEHTYQQKIVEDYHSKLMEQGSTALAAIRWLTNRGIDIDVIREYKLGLCRAKLKGEKDQYVPAISIPIPSYFGDKFYIKKRVAPWDREIRGQDNYKAWSQYKIPAAVFFSHKPENATETWLCEGEWDAIVLGWLVKQHRNDVAVASFTAGCGNVPVKDWTDKLPGEIKIFYDRNDKLQKDGQRIGDAAAQKVAKALKGRAKIAKVPMPEKCTVKGWDVSNAIMHGYSLESFERAALEAEEYRQAVVNNFLSRTRTLTELYRTAPDYVDWLVEDTLTTNELYCLAAAPRAGKSLLALGLAKAISTGGKFLGRQCQQGEVLYICKEDPDDKVKERLIAQAWNDHEMDNVLINRDFLLSDLPELKEYIRERRPALIIMDTLSRIQSNNARENTSEMTDVLAPLQDLAQNEGVCILVIHHTKKNVPQGLKLLEVFDAVRGSGAIRSTCRGMFVLSPRDSGYRLCIETGRTDPEDLVVSLNKETLIWHRVGDHKPTPVNASFRQQILEELEKNQQGTIDELYSWTGIHRKTIHKILTRLISDEEVCRKGRRRNTIYYKNGIRQVSTNKPLVETASADDDMDRGTFSTKKEISEKVGTTGQNCKEVLHFVPKTPVSTEKSNFVETGGKSGDNVVLSSEAEFRQVSTKEILSNNFDQKGDNGVIGESHRSDTTNNFFAEIEEEQEAQDIDKPRLTGVWHKEKGYLHVGSERGSKLTVRESGSQRWFEIDLSDCDERREYEDLPNQEEDLNTD